MLKLFNVSEINKRVLVVVQNLHVNNLKLNVRLLKHLRGLLPSVNLMIFMGIHQM